MNSSKKVMHTLIKSMKESGALKSSEIISAFETVRRADFVRPETISEADGDYPLPIGEGQTISQPSTVAFMLELLSPRKGQKILDVGSGSGWTTALLAKIVGKGGAVFGVERIPSLVSFGQNNISRYNFPWARIVRAGKRLGLPSKAPFDRILVSAAADEVPEELIEQLSENGIMVIPVGNSIAKVCKKPNGSIDAKYYTGFAFVPLITG